MSFDGPFGPKKSPFRTGGGGPGDTPSVDLNLTPLMDVMSNILFFLLAGFGAAIVTFLPASVPTQADSNEAPTPVKTDRVTMNVRLLPTGYELNASGEKIPAEKLAAWKRSIPKAAGAYDFVGLNQALAGVKNEFPASDTLILVPSAGVLYDEIIGTMDAAKEHRAEGSKVRLFPKVVVADVVETDDDVPEQGP